MLVIWAVEGDTHGQNGVHLVNLDFTRSKAIGRVYLGAVGRPTTGREALGSPTGVVTCLLYSYELKELNAAYAAELVVQRDLTTTEREAWAA